tara:strand:- start:273 stop:473 length:201 start_codon:yes stop_codon:yes gene_type:complete
MIYIFFEKLKFIHLIYIKKLVIIKIMHIKITLRAINNIIIFESETFLRSSESSEFFLIPKKELIIL